VPRLLSPHGGSVRGPAGLWKIIGQEFQGDESVKFGVLGLVDDTHASAAKSFKNAVMAKRLADKRIMT